MPKAKRHRPFWQADKPYLLDPSITDFRFRLLGYTMALLAGAINAGGFFAVGIYTSHVSGALSHAAHDLTLGQWQPALIAVMGVVCFILGAAHASWTILWAKRQRFRSCYGLAMWLEAFYLVFFGLIRMGFSQSGYEIIQPTILMLCFIMGMHNTVTTVLSGSAVRSTHMTGSATDLGIELSKMLYYRRDTNPRLPDVRVNRPKAKLLSGMMLSFVLGGLVGVWGYQSIGQSFTLPIAALLILFGANSVGYDIRVRFKWCLLRRKRTARRRVKNNKV